MVAFIGFCIYISIGIAGALFVKYVIDTHEESYSKIIDDAMSDDMKIKRSTFEFVATLYLYLKTTFLWPMAVWSFTKSLKRRIAEKRED